MTGTLRVLGYIGVDRLVVWGGVESNSGKR